MMDDVILNSDVRPRDLTKDENACPLLDPGRVGTIQHITGKDLRKKRPNLPTTSHVNKQLQEMGLG